MPRKTPKVLTSTALVAEVRLALNTGSTQQQAARKLVSLIEDVIRKRATEISIQERLVLKGAYKVACLFAGQRPALYVHDFGVHE